jgi:hypothetical protein
VEDPSKVKAPLDRRTFVQMLAAAPIALRASESAPPAAESPTPRYHVVTSYEPTGSLGMPGPYAGRVVDVRSERCLDASGDHIDAEVVREMMARGMCALTGETDAAAAWRRFFEPSDVVGLKVNCGGRPWVVSSHPLVIEVVRRLMDVGIPPTSLYIYERFKDQLDDVNYAPHLPEGVRIVAAEGANAFAGALRKLSDLGGELGPEDGGYDARTYVEADFFGEEDTRSNMMSLVSRRLTKIINIPNVKDHGATGATGCLKNIAYGSFSNVARTHYRGKSHTYSFVGTLATVEPLRSRTVLQIMDGLRGVWHGGPFAPTKRYVFYPKRLMFGTDPVAIDRLLLDIVDAERKAQGAISIWDRSPKYLVMDDYRKRDQDPNVNIIIREPGHVEYASSLGLGVADLAKIRVEELSV